MKLTADSRGRLCAADLFRPNVTFDATLQPDGSIRIVELVEKKAQTFRTRRVNGRLRPPVGFRPSKDVIAAAIRADRDSR